MDQPHTVMVILEAIEGKENEFKSALEVVAKKSRKEESCISYHFFQDPMNSTPFGLYEQWKKRTAGLLFIEILNSWSNGARV